MADHLHRPKSQLKRPRSHSQTNCVHVIAPASSSSPPTAEGAGACEAPLLQKLQSASMELSAKGSLPAVAVGVLALPHHCHHARGSLNSSSMASDRFPSVGGYGSCGELHQLYPVAFALPPAPGGRLAMHPASAIQRAAAVDMACVRASGGTTAVPPSFLDSLHYSRESSSKT